MEKGVADSAQVQIAGNTSLNFAAGNNGFFISNADHSKALGADIQTRRDLTLENGGIIGQINMQEGNYDAKKNLTVYPSWVSHLVLLVQLVLSPMLP